MRGGLAVALALAAAVPALGQAPDSQGPPPALVETAAVISAPITEEISLVGSVRPIRDSLIASEVAGRVLQRPVENGDTVKKGAPLVVLDRSRLERDLAQAEAELKEVEARLDLARRQEARAQELHASDVLAPRFLDDAMTERKAQEGRKAQVEARIAAIKDDLERSIIRAPFAGVVTEIRTEVGQWLEMGDPVARLADFDTIEITMDLPERHYPHISRGDAAPATLDALPGLRLDGKVFALVPRAGSAARTYPVIVRAPNPGRQVGAGMLARVKLILSTSAETLQVPKDAIVREQSGDVVYRVDGDTAQLVQVRTGRSNGNRIEVQGDLKAGDQVVVRGNERLAPGQKLRFGGGESANASAGSR